MISALPCKYPHRILSLFHLFHPLSFSNHLSPTYSHYALLLHVHLHYYHPQTPLFLQCPQQRLLPLLLEACSKTPSSDATRSVHALTITTGYFPSTFVSNNLLVAYAAVGELSTARQLFDGIPERNAVSYNSMIAAYNRRGDVVEALKLFSQMMASGLRPTQFTIGSILSSSSSLSVPCLGFQLQPLILKAGLFFVDAFSGTALLGFYARNERLDDALKVFEEMPRKNIVTWNAIITVFSQHGFVEDSMILFRELLRTEFRPSEFSFLGILSVCGWMVSFESGEQIHGLVIKTGTYYFTALANALIDMYARFFGVCIAEKMFNEIPIRDVVSWNTMVTAFTKSERPDKALELLLAMCVDGIFPNSTTFASVASSCASLKNLGVGKFIHAKTIKNNFISDVFVGSSLVNFYVKCNNLEYAHKLFDQMPDRNIVSWNALISGCLIKDSRSPVSVLQEMLHLGFRPNESSFSAVLKSCSPLELQQLHSLIIRMGYELNEYVSTSAIASYASNGLSSDALAFAEALTQSQSVIPSNVVAGIYNKTGQYQEAKNLLSQLQEPDIVSWNTLIEACARNGDCREAFELFKHMQTTQILPDKCTFVSLLSICSKLCNLALGSAIHGLIVKADSRCCDVLVCNMLVDMYAKCGSLESSVNVFDEIVDKNLISWTVLISGLGLHGNAHEALEKFKEMECQGIKPDRIALIAVLSSCRHGGLVEEGIGLFERMKDSYGVEPEMDHYVCLVDLLCRNGRVKEAEQVISSMPFRPNALLWRTFLEGCRRNNKIGS
ncbi:pentatricopeptide repeat-containing protein At3g58590 [Magnolia sinica]|uniref:pentatricopeptide repeat-containing protein At3g58590 n=1 Tax=Magnolia sinica TaxID=86752 RepID=UPI002659C76B|nr:pentatricopeptide repeat-containing protein At3g58590 [Magnolia sinica]XP_058100692.1 pentatricopeptide repeat-containing protein At3g58590 [Magnolia sinica]XP_058100693.1 pentatricopeptide repeat-containing protein At3g58590 [Magnolia sinica]XP_058100694.1 pentatricopeptide repeat-containing protein At3g58590 [Magnolia sinica]XP_058100695.1 pentatricopeptide repeat-containing protein At3g58590 [Magnolia sinica]XP_058100697.1 pentatricopeptide repeat-containing protein At3g58590 [Magnolia s